MMPSYRVLERVPHDTAFGVRFWDEATGRAVHNELTVVISPQFNLSMQAKIPAGLSGAYVTRRLPWTPAVSTAYRVEVTDPAGDFLPARFIAQLPSSEPFRLLCTSPVSGPYVPLFSAPQRLAPASMAVLRADLWDMVNDRPAAGALVQVDAGGGARGRGVADSRGRVAVIFGYPEPVRLPGLSPGAGSSLPLQQQTWEVGVRVFYRAGDAVFPRDLCDILQQPVAQAWRTSAGTAPFTGALLRFGQEAIARTLDATTLQPLSRLLVAPGV